MELTNDKFKLQDDEYIFPYHHISKKISNNKGERIVNSRYMDWGNEYMCYMLNIADKINSYPDKYKSVIDVGCGDGKLLSLINPNVKKTGVDLAERAILFAKAFNMDATILCEDVNNIDEKFDVVTCIEVLEHIPDEGIAGFVNGLFEHVTDDGVILLQVPTIVRPLADKHYRHYDLDLLNRQLSMSDFKYEIVNVEYIMKYTALYRALTKFIYNGLWIITIGKIDRFLWKYVNKKLKNASEKNGLHLLVTIKKVMKKNFDGSLR